MEQNAGGIGTVFTEGFKSGRSGKSRSANPHTAQSVEELLWFVGWDEGSAHRDRVNAKPDPDTLPTKSAADMAPSCDVTALYPPQLGPTAHGGQWRPRSIKILAAGASRTRTAEIQYQGADFLIFDFLA
jgi:ribosome modulation factor